MMASMATKRARRGLLGAVLGLGLLAAGSGTALAQDGEGFVPPLDPKDLPGPGQDRDILANQLHLPESRELQVLVRRAQEQAERGEWRAAVETYLELLRKDRAPDGGKILRLGEGRYVGYSRYARERLKAFPPEGVEAFRRATDAQAGAIYRTAAAAFDGPRLAEVAGLYPIGSFADDAHERLGDLALESGDLPLAARHYDAGLAVPLSDRDPESLGRKLELARAGPTDAAELARRRLPVEPAGPAPVPGGPARAAEAAPRVDWPVEGGSNAHVRRLEVPVDLKRPRFTVQLPPSRQGQLWPSRAARTARYRFEGLAYAKDEAFAEVHPAVVDGRLVIVTGRHIVAHDLRSGVSRFGPIAVWTGAEDRNGNLYYGATVAGGRIFAPFVHAVSRGDSYRGIPIKEEIPTRKLVAFDLRTGARLWHLAETGAADEVATRASFALPPIEREGVLYTTACVREGSLKTYVFALDAATGKVLWRRFLAAGQVELTMFGEHAVEPPQMQLAERGGILYACTASGAMYALSLDGEVQWAATYEQIPIEAAKTYYAIERDLPWRNTPPLATDDAVIVAPIDSTNFYVFDPATGAVRFRIDRNGQRQLVGVWDGKLVLAGDRVTGVDLAKGRVVWPRGGDVLFTEEEAGRGLISNGIAYIPFPSRVARFDATTGARLPDIVVPGGIRDSGTILATGREVIVINPTQATVYEVGPPSPPAAADGRKTY